MTRFITSYTGAIRSNMRCTPSGASVPSFTVSSGPSWPCIDRDNSLTPALDQRIFDTKLIQSAGDDEIDEVFDGLGSMVEAGCEEEDRRAGAPGREHRLEMDRRERRLARHQHEPALLFQRDRRGPVDQVLHRARRD